MKTRLIFLSFMALLILPVLVSGQGSATRNAHTGTQVKPAAMVFNGNLNPEVKIAPASTDSGSYKMDFENVPDFSLTFNDWTVNDVDLHGTYGITGYSFPHQTEPMAFLCFNPAQVTPSMASDPAMQPHGGQRFGACFSSNPPSNSDWFISPQVQLDTNGSFSFWVKSYTDFYGLDSYTVAVSTTDNNPASFTVISGAQPLRTTISWVKKTFSLSGYNNQKVFVAIHCISNDNFLLMIDDMELKPGSATSLTADFTADKTTLRLGEPVNFTDMSTGMPTSWSWTFYGGNPLTSTLQNPTGISYSTPGVYTVSLRVSNGSSIDSLFKTDYITVTGYPTSVSLDFESLTDFVLTFEPWIALDVKGGYTYGIQNVTFPHNYDGMAYICFNPSQTSPPLTNMTAHSGQKLGCCFSSMPPMNPNDKWLISPKISLGLNPQVDFWVKTYNNQFGYERFNVCVSNTDLSSTSFVPLTAHPDSAQTEWTLKTYSLGAYTNQDVYVGIQCVTNDGFIFMLDDITIASSVGISEENLLNRLVVYPNPAKDYLFLNCPAGTALLNIDLINLLGETVSSWRETAVAGRIMLDVGQVKKGVYLLRMSDDQATAVRKISIIN